MEKPPAHRRGLWVPSPCHYPHPVHYPLPDPLPWEREKKEREKMERERHYFARFAVRLVVDWAVATVCSTVFSTVS